MTRMTLRPLALIGLAALLTACGKSSTSLGEGGSVISGSAGPAGAHKASRELVKCDAPVATMALVENPNGYSYSSSYQLPSSPVPLVRLDGTRDLSSASQRWAVQAAPSANPQWNRQAPGVPAWQAELFRARSHPPGTWRLSEDGGRLVAGRHIPLPVQEVGEGRTKPSDAAAPSPGSARSLGASVAILSPTGERVSG